MQPVPGGTTPLAGASATLPRTSPNQANPTVSQQYATLPTHVIIPKTEASQSCTAVKMENAQSATSQSSIPAFASALDNSVTQPVQSSASTADYAALHLQPTFINQGSYPTAVPATVHYAVQVPNYGIPPLPQIAPPPPPSASVSFPSHSHTGHFPSSIHPLSQTAPPPAPNLSFYSIPDNQSHISQFPLSFPVPNYSTYPTHSNTANESNPLNSLPVGYSATGTVPGPPSSVNLISNEGPEPPHSYRPYSQYSSLRSSTTTSSTEGDIPQQSHIPYCHYATLPPLAITSTRKGGVPFSSYSPYSQYSTHQPFTTTTSTHRTVPPQSHTTYSQSSTAPLSTTTSSTEIAALPQAQALYSQYSALPPGTSTSFSDETKSPSSHSLYSQYSTIPPSITSHDKADIYSSTDDLLDPIALSRKPNARLSGKKIAVMEVGL